jgi:porphyrinogen peroxidase
MAAWNALPAEQQEKIIGRTKLDDIELDDATKPAYAHNALTTITEDGEEVKILRDNMPFGTLGTAEYGTYFIGYARTPARTELMLQNMFAGRPEGNYDRLLDVSRAVTGNLFFVPSVPVLESLADMDAPDAAEPVTAAPEAGSAPEQNSSLHSGSLHSGSLHGGSLHIGSLRGASEDG